MLPDSLAAAPDAPSPLARRMRTLGWTAAGTAAGMLVFEGLKHLLFPDFTPWHRARR